MNAKKKHTLKSIAINAMAAGAGIIGTLYISDKYEAFTTRIDLPVELEKRVEQHDREILSIISYIDNQNKLNEAQGKLSEEIRGFISVQKVINSEAEKTDNRNDMRLERLENKYLLTNNIQR